MRFSVNWYHINCGKKRNPHSCPVALVISGAVKLGVQVAVIPNKLRLTPTYGYEISIALPPEVEKFRCDFDWNDVVTGPGRLGEMVHSHCRPFEFEIDIPEEMVLR